MTLNPLHSATCRILDAAANRCREGLRVLEDYVRFQENAATETELLKHLRHDLARVLDRLQGASWLAARDTSADVGTSISTATEYQRQSLEDVLRANALRVGEALRSLEEYSKLLDAGAARELEQLRYRFYTLEQQVLCRFRRSSLLAGRSLCLLLTEQICQHHPWETVLIAALAGGVDIVQLREKQLDGKELLRRANLVREATAAVGALFIVNDRPDLALLSGADGVHLGQDDLPLEQVRDLLGPQTLIGLSTHSVEQLQKAIAAGADYVGVGPTFPSRTKAFDQYAGLQLLRQVAAIETVPRFAIGGIDLKNVVEVRQAGIRQIAVSSAICGAIEPESAARRLREVLRQNA